MPGTRHTPASSDRIAAVLGLGAMTVGIGVAGAVEWGMGTWNWPDAIGPAFVGTGWVWVFLTRRSRAASMLGGHDG